MKRDVCERLESEILDGAGLRVFGDTFFSHPLLVGACRGVLYLSGDPVAMVIVDISGILAVRSHFSIFRDAGEYAAGYFRRCSLIAIVI